MRRGLIRLFALSFFFQLLAAQKFFCIETQHVKLVYFSAAEGYLAKHIVRSMESALASHRQNFGYTPSDKVLVFLHDFNDRMGGSATSLPRNVVIIAAAPTPYVLETVLGNERMSWLSNHELTHIATFDMASRRDRLFRAMFFGKVTPTADQPLSMLYNYLTAPRTTAPRWFLEGIAVFMETWLGGGLGRSLGAYDEMVFRTIVQENRTLYDRTGLESEGIRVEFQVGAISYLYGARFFSYLGQRWGPEKVIQFVARTDDSKAYYASQFERVFGVPIDQAWQDWIAFEREFQQRNLERIRENPVTRVRLLTKERLGSVSPAQFDPATRELYFGTSYPGQVSHLAALNVDTGVVRKIHDIKGPVLYLVTSTAYDPSTGELFYTTDNNSWRDLNVINVKTGKQRLILKDCRIGDLAFSPADKSIWGVRRAHGVSTLVRIPYPYTEWNQVYSWPYGQDCYDIDVSPDGKTLSLALTEITGIQSLLKVDTEAILKGEYLPTTLFDFGYNSPASFRFSPDGRYLYGSSYFTGVSNIFRYDLARSDMEVLSNSETGLFRPWPLDADSCLAFEYTNQGFQPVLIPNRPAGKVRSILFLGQEVVDKYPIVKTWQAASPATIPLEELTVYEGPYSHLGNLKLVSMYPIVEGYKDSAAYGARADFMSLFDHLAVSGAYSPSSVLGRDEKWHARVDFQHMLWKARFAYNGADFYDLFGPTKTSRKGYSFGVERKQFLIFDEPNRYLDYTLSFDGYGGLDRLPDYQNIEASYSRLLNWKARIDYQYLMRSGGAIDDEKGYQLQLTSSNNYVGGDFFPRIYGKADYGFALPIKHSSVWARTSAGHSFGDRASPFANFYFGGFGNNWVDHLNEYRYREYYSFPGLELNEIGGANYAKGQVEWHLPPMFFKRVGPPSFFLNWARPVIFTSGLITNLDDRGRRRKAANIGAQMDFRLIATAWRELTLSVGYAGAKADQARSATEFMVSLKIN